MFVIGIDGGGTRTRARLANTRGETLGDGEAGACNPQAVGFDNSYRAIEDAIARAFDAARIEKQIVAASCLGIGGVDRDTERNEFTRWAREKISPRIEICTDSQIVLAAGTPEGWGVALIAGTGSIAFGKTRDGKIARAGGWGFLIGDEGSAYDLARRALNAITQAADGRGEKTRLVEMILQFWKLKAPMEIIPRVYRSDLKPAEFAQLAPLVLRAAEAGDAVAREIISDAARELALAIFAVARALRFAEEKIPLAFAGGLLLGAELLQKELWARLKENFAPIALVREPVVGAVKIARELAHP